jgi:hypothetical protein
LLYQLIDKSITSVIKNYGPGIALSEILLKAMRWSDLVLCYALDSGLWVREILLYKYFLIQSTGLKLTERKQEQHADRVPMQSRGLHKQFENQKACSCDRPSGIRRFLLPDSRQSCTMCAVSLGSRIAQSLYDFLDVGKSPRPADCIFVPAGKQERKIYGIKMWRFGYARQLILSVGRFEWRKFNELDIESDGGLQALVEQIPHKTRHFLVRFDRQNTTCTFMQKGLFGTRSEARSLAEYLRELPVRSLLVVSSPVHLRRVALAFRRAFRRSGIQLTFVAVPEKPSLASPAYRSEVWSEFGKYLLYKLLF